MGEISPDAQKDMIVIRLLHYGSRAALWGQNEAEFGVWVTVSVSGAISESKIGCGRADEDLEYLFLRKIKGFTCWRGCIALLWKVSRG